MAATSVRGAPGDIKSAFVTTALTGAETVTVAVPAGDVAIIIDSTFSANDISLAQTIKRLLEYYKETVEKLG